MGHTNNLYPVFKFKRQGTSTHIPQYGMWNVPSYPSSQNQAHLQPWLLRKCGMAYIHKYECHVFTLFTEKP